MSTNICFYTELDNDTWAAMRRLRNRLTVRLCMCGNYVEYGTYSIPNSDFFNSLSCVIILSSTE